MKIRETDRGWKALKARLDKFAGAVKEITVGIHAQDGDAPKGDTKLLDVALAHEFGLGVPRRSFIADWHEENRAKHEQQMIAMAKAIVAGTVPSAEVAAQRLANLWVGEVQKRIVAGIAPALAEETVRRKKSSTPLIDTGQLRSSVSYAIDGKLAPSKAATAAAKKQVAAAKKAAKKERAALVKKAKKTIGATVKKLKKAATKKKRSTKKARVTR